MSELEKKTAEKKLFKWKIPVGVQNVITSVMVGATAMLSRNAFASQVADAIGSHAARANLEHGMEAFAAFAYIKALEQLAHAEHDQSSKKILLAIRLGYIFLLLYFENQQSVDFSRPIQWDQLISSGLGMALAQLFLYVQEKNDSKK